MWPRPRRWLDALLSVLLGAGVGCLATTLVVGVAFGAPAAWAIAWVWDVLPGLRPPLDLRWIPLLGAAGGALLGARLALSRGG